MKSSECGTVLLPNTQETSEGILVFPKQGGGLLLEDRLQGDRFLCMKIMVLETHSMAFELRVFDMDGQKRVTVRFGIMPQYPTAVSLDMQWLDGHVLYPGHGVGQLKTVCHGSRIHRADIGRAELVSLPCHHSVHVHLEGPFMQPSPMEPLSMPSGFLVDAMGQYIPKKWEGKTENQEEMVARLREDAGKEKTWPFADRNRWGGWRDLHLGEGTGYFQALQRDGRWFLADPDGCAFFSLGADCVVARCDARLDGMEGLVEGLDQEREDPSFGDVWREADRFYGEETRKARLYSFERANLRRAFGKDWKKAWQDLSIRLLMRLGMNTLGNWSDPELYPLFAHVMMLEQFPETTHCIFRDFPDVLSPEYAQNAQTCAAFLRPRREDHGMIGYFLRNEPSWAFVDGLIVADEVLRDPEDTYCRRGLIDFLKSRYRTVEALSQAWKTTFDSFEELRHPIEKASALSEQAEIDLRDFSEKLIERYVGIPSEACRREDPNHMNLGMRWAWISDPAIVSGWRHFDAFSINCYAVDPTEAIRHVRELGVDLPVMIGEFHFGSLDRGNTATGLEGVLNEEERGKALSYYVERAAADPCGVGCHWFQFSDQFVLGRFDGENYHIGLTDVTLKPHEAMEEAGCRTGMRLKEIMLGQCPPTDDRPISIPMIAY